MAAGRDYSWCKRIGLMMNRNTRIFGGSDCIDDNVAAGGHHHRLDGCSSCALIGW